MITKRALLLLALAGSAFGINASIPANAQVYPSRPITIIVPFPAGGPLDTVARLLAEHMRLSLAQTVTIENVAGAGGLADPALRQRIADLGLEIPPREEQTPEALGAV